MSTMRERLRQAAAFLDRAPGQHGLSAAALRTLATRMDEELSMLDGLRDSCSEIERGVLLRLDAPIDPAALLARLDAPVEL